jgi:hypothetical protein
MNPIQSATLLAILVGFVVLEYVLKRAQRFGASKGDNTLDLLGFGLLVAVTQPFIFLGHWQSVCWSCP